MPFSIPIKIIKSKRKTISIKVDPNFIVVRAPKLIPNFIVEKTLKEKSDWINKAIVKSRTKTTLEKLVNKNHIFFQGEKFNLEIRADCKNLTFKNGIFYISSTNNLVNDIHKYLEKNFKPFLEKEIKAWAMRMEIEAKLKHVRLSKAITSWGSCSSRGVISINWQLALLPKPLLQYVIIHELCHLTFMNHQKEFWESVEKYKPNYRQDIMELKNFSLKN
jgi:predicted metal-dependent hydrolase